jgi:adenosine deaminase
MPSGSDLPPYIEPELSTLLERLPKVDLHLHLVGAMRARPRGRIRRENASCAANSSRISTC